jgi:hypothetical protein
LTPSVRGAGHRHIRDSLEESKESEQSEEKAVVARQLVEGEE